MKTKLSLKQHVFEALIIALIIVLSYVAIRNAIIGPLEDEQESSGACSQNSR